MKIFVLFIMSMFTIIACNVNTSDSSQNKEKEYKEILTGKLSFDQTIYIMKKHGFSEGKFTSEKHQYKVFKSGTGRYTIMGITHDPNCQYCFDLYD